MRPPYEAVIAEIDLPGKLGQFNPVVIGTPPLGIDVSSSDIDIACSAHDLESFSAFVSQHFGGFDGFLIRDVPHLDDPARVACFRYRGWDIELFCQKTETAQQFGVRHFLLERRLLSLEPRLKGKVRVLKEQGLKTEPAFASLLGLGGDPYAALLELEDRTDLELRELIDSIEI